MYARLVELTAAGPPDRDSVMETMRDRVIPMLRDYEGFAGYVGLFDDEGGRGRGLLLWETRDAAEAAEETLEERRQQMAGSTGMSVQSADLYEVLALDLQRAAAQV